MKKHEIRYALRDSWQNIVRHPLVLIASVTTVALMLLLMSFYVAFSLNATHVMQIASQQPPIQLTMNLTCDEQQLIEMDAFLAGDARVLDYEQYSPEQNLERFKADMDRDELFEEESLINVFPNTFSVRLNDPADSESFRESVAIMPGVHEVKMQQGVMELLDRVTHTVNQVGIIAFIVLAVIATLVVSNMVRVSVLSRSTEIGIMKYVGATNMYVRIPFVVEGIFAGVIGATIATLITSILYASLNRGAGDNVGSVFGRMADEFAMLPTSQIVVTVLVLNLVIGLALSVVASSLSVRRHIRV